MRLTFLGTGTAWSKAPKNFNNNALVEAGNGQGRWLIDCGTTAPQALYELGLDVASFDGVLITHLHGDHVFGLEETGFYNFFVKNRRVKLWLPHELLESRSGIAGEDIWENCLRGSMGTVQRLDGTAREVGLDDYFEVILMETGQLYDVMGVQVELFPVEHVPNKPCFGLILDGRVGYTSDCTWDARRVEWLLERGCEVIYHDVYFGPAFPGRVHTAYEEIAVLPPEVASRIVLMHYNDDVSAEALARARDAGFRIALKHEPYSHA